MVGDGYDWGGGGGWLMGLVMNEWVWLDWVELGLVLPIWYCVLGRDVVQYRESNVLDPGDTHECVAV